MRNVTRKVFISIFTTLIVTMTMFATTFAWVGMLTTSTLGGFDMNLKTVKNEMPYHLMISADGENFSDSVSSADIQKQIMSNMGIDYNELLGGNQSASAINSLFARTAKMEPSTTKVLADNSLDDFYAMNDLVKGKTKLTKTNKYFKFDLYLSVESNEGNQASTSINANVIFTDIEKLITGMNCSGTLMNDDPFVGLDSSDPYYSILSGIPNTFSIDSSSATRVAFSLYNPINIKNSYKTTDLPNKTIIYQGGTQAPSYSNGKYSLGGILPESENLAIKEINKIYSVNADIDSITYDDDLTVYSIDSKRKNDLELKDENKVLFAKPSSIDTTNINFLGIDSGIQTKMKITVYFWFEGWDADCLRFIDTKSAMLNISFSTDND